MARTAQLQGSTGTLGQRSLWTVLLLALLARLAVLASLLSRSAETWIYQRGLETGFVAHSLLMHEGFSSPFGGHTGPTALISPGYVLLVAGIFRICGDASQLSAVIILLVQIALGVLTVWLIMRLAERLAGERAAVLAGCYFALWPTFWWVPTIFWDTSLTLCLLPGLLLLATRLRERPSRGTWLGFGLLCGVTVLINLALCVVVVAVFCWCVWAVRGNRRDALLAAACALLLYAPWPVRNARALHAFVPLRTTVGLELWMGNRAGASGYLDESVFPLYNRRELASYVERGEVAYMQAKAAAAAAAIQQHPGVFLDLTARRFVRFWFGTGTRSGSALYALGATLTTLCGLAGLIVFWRRGGRPHYRLVLLYALPLLLFPLPYYITHAEFRYRLALEPELIAIASAFAVRCLRAAEVQRGSPALRQSETAVASTVSHA